MKIVECPRDAMQGIGGFIPTALKTEYINSLLRVGFDTIDFGSFVSPKAIPQMRDTREVLEGLHLDGHSSKLLAIVANIRGVRDAVGLEEINYFGYPLSLSETFQKLNTNRSIEVALNDLAEIQELCQVHDKTLVVYLSMGFGNPYGDPYEEDYVVEFVHRLDQLEVEIISLADTIGVSDPDGISRLYESLIPGFPHIEFGAHLHSYPQRAREKIEAAFTAGCRRIDGAIGGFGGCPMAKDELVGNLPTETIIDALKTFNVEVTIDEAAFNKSQLISKRVFR